MLKELILFIAILLIVFVFFRKSERMLGGNEKKALELGFGGIITIPPDFDVTAVDIEEYSPDKIEDPEKRHIRVVKSDMEGFCEGEYDLIKMRNSWHYVINYKKMLEHLKKMLKSDGVIFIREPGAKGRWMDPRLNSDSAEFKPRLLELKMNDIYRARNALLLQNYFNVEETQREDEGFNYKLTHK